jgi:hypothetical protein
MATKKDQYFFPWDLYFALYEKDTINETELNNVVDSCQHYPIKILNMAADTINVKKSTFKRIACMNIIKGLHEKYSDFKNNKMRKNEKELKLSEMKRDIKDKYFKLANNDLENVEENKIEKTQEEKEINKNTITGSIAILKYLEKQLPKKPVFSTFYKNFSKDNNQISKDILNSLFKSLVQMIDEKTKNMTDDKVKIFIQEHIKNLNDQIKQPIQYLLETENNNEENNKEKINVMKKYMKNKGWNDNSKYSNSEEMNEYLFDKLLDEEKQNIDNLSILKPNLEKLKLELDSTKQKYSEQNNILKTMSKAKKYQEQRNKLEEEKTLLKQKQKDIAESIDNTENKIKKIETNRKHRKQLCHQLDYDEDIIDQAIIADDLKCESEKQVCNLKSNVCEDDTQDNKKYNLKIKDIDIPLIPEEDAKLLDEKIKQMAKNQPQNPRYVSMTTPESQPQYLNPTIKQTETIQQKEENVDLDTEEEEEEEEIDEDEFPLVPETENIVNEDAECFTQTDYDRLEDLEQDLDCEDDQICDISNRQCIDKLDDDFNITKVGNKEYTFSSLSNVDLMNKIKNKFKHTTITNIDQQNIDIPIIDMEVPPAHVSEKVELDKFVNVMNNIQSKPRLSVDSKFDDRTKARRDMIRKCLNL